MLYNHNRFYQYAFNYLLVIIIKSQQKHFDTAALHVKEITLKLHIRTVLKGLQCSVASVTSTSPVLVSAMLLLLLNKIIFKLIHVMI